jgi:tetratricopeptide (TPR) repeat protein
VSRSEATLEALLGLLPDLDDLEVLRLRLVGAAGPDPQKEWDSSKIYATIDKRIVSAEAAERAVDEASEALRQYVTYLHDGLRPVLRAFFAEDPAEAARALVSLGEQLESSGRVVGARQCYVAALNASLPLQEKGSQILALRRIGRVSLNVGDFQEAISFYERSADLAGDAGDLAGEVIARTGLGNVRMWQGRWDDADSCYAEALALTEGADGALQMELGHLYNNMANLRTHQGRPDEAEIWFDRALGLWAVLKSPVDEATCHFNRAQLREDQGRWDEAQQDYEAALALPIPSSLRAGVATDYAEWWLHSGHLTQAEEWGRVSEEHAIAARSPYTLGRMYQGRGNIARARKDMDGFTFFEKALEIARDKKYPYLEAETLVDYAELRAANGGAEEAMAYLERACEIFREIGGLGQLERAEKALAELSGRDEEEPPRAAAD